MQFLNGKVKGRNQINSFLKTTTKAFVFEKRLPLEKFLFHFLNKTDAAWSAFMKIFVIQYYVAVVHIWSNFKEDFRYVSKTVTFSCKMIS